MKYWFFFYIQDINSDIIIELNIIFDCKAESIQKLSIFLAVLTIFGQMFLRHTTWLCALIIRTLIEDVWLINVQNNNKNDVAQY